jgi:hypothetical protein
MAFKVGEAPAEIALITCKGMRQALEAYGRFGFHSRASRCASATCAGVILAATKSRACAAASWYFPGGH